MVGWLIATPPQKTKTMKKIEISNNTASLIEAMQSTNNVYNRTIALATEMVGKDDEAVANLENSYKAFYDALSAIAIKSVQQNLCVGDGCEI